MPYYIELPVYTIATMIWTGFGVFVCLVIVAIIVRDIEGGRSRARHSQSYIASYILRAIMVLEEAKDNWIEPSVRARGRIYSEGQ